MRLRSHSQEAVDPNPGQADSHSAACLPDGLHSDFWGMGIGGVLALVSGQPHTRKESVYPSWGGGRGEGWLVVLVLPFPSVHTSPDYLAYLVS